jgi:hypothetical protein
MDKAPGTPADSSTSTSKTVPDRGYVLPVGSRLADRLEPFLSLGYRVSRVELPKK